MPFPRKESLNLLTCFLEEEEISSTREITEEKSIQNVVPCKGIKQLKPVFKNFLNPINHTISQQWVEVKMSVKLFEDDEEKFFTEEKYEDCEPLVPKRKQTRNKKRQTQKSRHLLVQTDRLHYDKTKYANDPTFSHQGNEFDPSTFDWHPSSDESEDDDDYYYDDYYYYYDDYDYDDDDDDYYYY
jgi:hypothetical protein